MCWLRRRLDDRHRLHGLWRSHGLRWLHRLDGLRRTRRLRGLSTERWRRNGRGGRVVDVAALRVTVRYSNHPLDTLLRCETLLVAMVLHVTIRPNPNLASAVQGLLGAAAQLLAHRTAILETVRAVLLDHFVHALHAEHLGALLAVNIAAANVAAAMTGRVVAFLDVRFNFLSVTIGQRSLTPSPIRSEEAALLL